MQVEEPEVGSTTQIGVTIFLEGTPGAVKGPQPMAGADNDEVLRSLGRDDTDITALRTKGVI